MRQLEGGSIDAVLVDPARSRARHYLSLTGELGLTDVERYERATACLDAPIDDLHPGLVAQAHERRLTAASWLFRKRPLEPRDLTRVREALAAQRSYLRGEGATLTRMGEALRSELDMRCVADGWLAPQVMRDLDAFRDAPVGRADWWVEAMRARLRVVSRLLEEAESAASLQHSPEEVAILANLALDQGRRLTASDALAFEELWEARAMAIRACRLSGLLREGQALVLAHPAPTSWGHPSFPLEAARLLRLTDPPAALAIVRAALQRGEWVRHDGGRLFQALPDQLVGGPLAVAGPGPTRLGRYDVLRELGRGGMGVVYEVRDPDLPERRLALKLARSDAR